MAEGAGRSDEQRQELGTLTRRLAVGLGQVRWLEGVTEIYGNTWRMENRSGKNVEKSDVTLNEQNQCLACLWCLG